MLREQIKDWKALQEYLEPLIISKPSVADIREFYTEELDFLVVTSLLYKKYGKPRSIVGIAQCFMSNIKDLFVYALQEDQFEVLDMLDRIVDSQFTIFSCYAEVYMQEENISAEVHATLCMMEDTYNKFKTRQLNNY